jgi:hypothetical protein
MSPAPEIVTPREIVTARAERDRQQARAAKRRARRSGRR